MLRYCWLLALVATAFSAVDLRAGDEVATALTIRATFYRGKWKDGREKATKTSAPTLTQSIGGRIGTSQTSTFFGRDSRIVPSLLEDDKLEQQAEIARGDREFGRVGPPRELSSGDRITIELHGFRDDRVRGEIFLEVTEPAKGNEEELLTASGACVRKMGMFMLGKTYQLASPADSQGEATWVEFVIERAKDDPAK